MAFLGKMVNGQLQQEIPQEIFDRFQQVFVEELGLEIQDQAEQSRLLHKSKAE